MKKIILIFLLISRTLCAQVQKNVEIEVLGRPSWQMVIPMKTEGLILFTKTDMTKARMIMYDEDLNPQWDKEIFLDVERRPTAYTYDRNHATFLFRESRGMYYQLFTVDLATGKIDIQGFELREYFVDQDYIFLGNTLIMSGSNEKGGAFYFYNFREGTGRLVQSGFEGKTDNQHFEYNPEKKLIESVWAIKTIGYSNEKKKKGEFTKDAFVVYAEIDTLGNTLRQVTVPQKGGSFPISGRLLRMRDGTAALLGAYQANTGDKGIYYASLSTATGKSEARFHSFTRLLSGQPDYTADELKKIITGFTFLPHEPVQGDETISFGGVFFKPEYSTVSERIYDPYYSDPYYQRGGGLFGRSNTRTQTRQVFNGYNYISGFVASLNAHGELLEHHRIDINQVSPRITQTLSYNVNGAVAYCVKGNLAARNFNIGNRPILYKLSEDEITPANRGFIPAYQEVRFWYDNYFIADGARNRIEAVSLNDNQDSSSGKSASRKKKAPATFSQVRKIIYLTKIASGS